MPKSQGKPKAKRRWSGETIRRRGVRAVVAGLRLGKECQRLLREHACHLEETEIRQGYLEYAGALNKSLREANKERREQTVRSNGNGNSWMNGDHSSPRNPTGRVDGLRASSVPVVVHA